MSSVELPVCRTQFVHSVFHPCAYQDQTLSHTLTFYLTRTLFFLICKVHPAPNSSPPVLPVSVGVKLAIKFFFGVGVCIVPSECRSVLLVWRETMRTRQGFVVAEMHF